MERHLPYELTKEGLERLNKQLQETESKLAKLLLQKQEIATTQGDYWHDNPSFDKLEGEERALRLEIRNIRKKLTRAVIVEETNQEDEVKIGSFVLLILESDKKETEFKIVDPEISDPSKGFISYASPLGKAILGARAGDIRTYSVGEKKFQVQIVKVGGKNEEQR